MARPATEYRNEVKSRLRDDAFAAVQCAMRLYGCSESRAVAILVERGAFGMVGRMPAPIADNSPEMGINGPVIAR